MNLVLTRIDNRLIHGQVLEAWVPYAHADCIVVANDDIASSPLKRMMMESSVPSRMLVEIGSVEEVVALFIAGTLAVRKTLLLFGNTADALRAYRSGLRYQKLNLGNLHAGDGKARLSCTIFLGPQDINSLQELEAAGVIISARCIPADNERSWKKLLPQRKVQK